LTGSGRNKILALPKGEIAMLANDSILLKFTSCGALDWAKVIKPFSGTIRSGNKSTTNNFFISTKDKGFGILNHITLNQKYNTSILKFDSLGNQKFSIELQSSQFDQYPYSMDQDNDGNLFLYGNISPIGGGEPFRTLTKISPVGNVIWTRRYSNGYNYGYGFCTEDGGFLIYTWRDFIKINKNGNVEWSNLVDISTDNDILFFVEMDDGFVIGSRNNDANTFVHGLTKLSKDGQVIIWQKKSYYVDFIGPKRKSNGHWLSLTNHGRSMAERLPFLIEYDKDFNFIKSNIIKNYNHPTTLGPTIFQIQENQSVIFSGVYAVHGTRIRKSFLARTDSLLQLGCRDTNITFANTLPFLPIQFSATLTQSFAHSWNIVSKPMQVKNVFFKDSTACGTFIPHPDLGKDTSFCFGQSIGVAVKNSSAFDSFLWSGSQKTQKIEINQAGTYWVEAVNVCERDTLRDSIQIVLKKIPDIVLSSETEICDPSQIKLVAKIEGAENKWQDGSTDSVFIASKAGNYYVDLKQNECMKRIETTITECEKLEMPNMISPNGDSRNDRFLPIWQLGVSELKMEIYDRWGKKVFSSGDLQTRNWAGEHASEGVYFWMLEFKNGNGEAKKQRGWVQLVKE